MIAGAVVGAARVLLPAAPFGSEHLLKALVVTVLCQVCLYYAELYDFKVLADRRELLVRLLQSLGVTSLLLAVIYAWFPTLVIGRGVFVLSTLLVIAGALGWRLAFLSVNERLGGHQRLLMVGTSAATVSLARELRGRKDLGIQIVGFVDQDPRPADAPPDEDVPIVGALDDIPSIVRNRRVDRVVVSLSDARGRLPMDRLLQMKLEGIRVDHLATVYEEYTGKIALENLRPSWLIFSDGFCVGPFRHGCKRCVDLLAATAGLVASLPLMAIVALAVKVTDGGPVLYRQLRVGQRGRVFTLFKFRSMRVDAERHTGAVWASEGDTRVTTVGRFLRATRLDEIPQFWNVLRGDMSFVGPRPERPEFVRELTARIPFYGQRHVLKPGLTGWAQVQFSYGGSIEGSMEKLQRDLFYIKNMSPGLDLFIMLKTVQTILMRPGT